MRIIEAALSRTRTTLAVFVLLLLAGATAYVTIPKEADPDVDIPFISVTLRLDGISPEDSERLMVRPLEEELRSVEGVKEITSKAYESGASIVLEFDAGFDADSAVQDVREAVDRARTELPDEAEDPIVQEINTSLFPVIVVTLSGEVPERTLLHLARVLRDDLETIPSILEVRISGDREEVVEITIDPLLVESYGLNGSEVAMLLSRSNRVVAAGNLQTDAGRFAVKVPGLFESAEDILNMPLRVDGDAVVRVRDVGRVRQTFKDPEGFARLDGRPAVALEVAKRSGENVLETIAAVRAAVERERAVWPSAVQVTYSQDQSEFISTMLRDLENQVLAAILLVMFVLVGALGLRSSLLVGVAVPGSFLTGILVLQLLGLTVNIVVLFALILSVGMLVDAAVMVVEYADRKMAEGLDPRRAFVTASTRLAVPVITATATTLVAFVPLLFWPGVVGEFMKYFPITLLATLTASLAMALVFVPTVGAYLGRVGATSQEQLRTLAVAESGDLDVIRGPARAYLRLLRLALRYPSQVLVMTLTLLVGAWYGYVVHGKGVEFFPQVESDFALVLVHGRGNLSVYEKDALVREVEQRLAPLAGEVQNVYARSGNGGTTGWDTAEDVIGQITLELKDWNERRPAAEILEEARRLTGDLPGVIVETRTPDVGPPVGKPVQVQLSSRSPELLPAAVDVVRGLMEATPGLKDIEDTRPPPGIEWELSVDRAQAAKFGLDVTAVGDAIKLVTSGLIIGSYRPDRSDDEIDIAVRYPPAWRTIDQLDQLRVVTNAGPVPISNFVARAANPKVGSLDRRDLQRIMLVKADVRAGVLVSDTVEALRAKLAGAGIDPRIDVTFKGQDEEQQAAQSFLVNAFWITLFLMAIILVTEFNRFYSAFLVLTAVIFSTIGAMLGLLITDQPFGIVVTGIGMIALAGVVVNSNIILIDTYDDLRSKGMDTVEALLRTGVLRLRPVFLTAGTTILGVLPMVLKVNIDLIDRAVTVGAPSTQWWVSLATVISFGLAFATLLTLIATPCALMLQERVHAWRTRAA